MNKKGLTLIELIAVIIILGIIAIIATPAVLNVIEESQERARQGSVIGYADSVKMAYMDEKLSNTGRPLKDLADEITMGDKVECQNVKYDDQQFGSLLTGCSVKGKGNYCYMNGVVYNDDTTECKGVESIVENDSIVFRKPKIEEVSHNPSEYEYAQDKTIRVVYERLLVVEEHFYIRSNKPINVSVTKYCGNGTLPSNCTDSTTFEINKWYEVSDDLEFTITENM